MHPRVIITAFLLVVFTSVSFAGEQNCFIKDGDCVGFFGDSITDAKVYGRITELVFRHFHPDARVTFVNNGHSGIPLAGVTADSPDILKDNPNVVTIMLGMNDAILSPWVRGMPIEPVVTQYKNNLVKLVRGLKAKSKVVVIFTPSLTDERVETSCFKIEGTKILLQAFGKACEEVGHEESVPCIPIGSEFEDYQDSLPGFAQLRDDGVHPNARGHYQIARSLWTHLNLAGPLKGGRDLSPAQLGDIKISLASNMLAVNSDSIVFSFETTKPGPARLSWNAGDSKGTDTLTLTGKNEWTLKLPKKAFPETNGKAVTLVMDIESQGVRQIFIVDIFRRMVVHGKDGTVSGTLTNGKGEPIASYQFKKASKGLIFEASVKKSTVFHDPETKFPWGGGDALTLFLDTRKETEFGGLGFDGDVYQIWFRPRENPFSPGFHPWTGKPVSTIATTYGEKAADGYKVGMQLDGYINLQERYDVSDRDFIGFDISLFYAMALGKQETYSVQSTDRPTFIYPSVMAVADLNGKLKDDSVYSVTVFPDQLSP